MKPLVNRRQDRLQPVQKKLFPSPAADYWSGGSDHLSEIDYG